MESTTTRTMTPWFVAGAVLGLLLIAGGCNCGAENVKACTTSNQCAATETCQDNVCTATCNPSCKVGEVCDDAACFPRNCENGGCSDNEFCFEGKCTAHGCRGVTCASDKKCTLGGSCVALNCGGSGTACDAKTEACDPETKTCTDSSCIGVTCPPGQTCWGGSCRSNECEDGRVCAGSYCAEGNYCKDCAAAACPGTSVCVEGVCRPKGCLLLPQRDCPCGKSGITCADGELCIGATKDVERCMKQDCARVACGPGFVCAGEACKPIPCVDVKCGEDEVCAADGKCYANQCNNAYCPEGFACVNGACASIACVGKTCPSGEACFNGGCYKTNTECGGTQCNAPNLCINQVCVPGTPEPPGPIVCGTDTCPTGYTCDSTVSPPRCLPTECVGRACPSLCGLAMCQPGQLCDQSSGTCLEKCSMCPDGFVCNADNTGCVPVSCLDKACPAGQTCLPDGSCAPTGAPDPTDPTEDPTRESCEEGEALDANGNCVDVACVGTDCGANGTCINGVCYVRCCEGNDCGADGVCLNGRQYQKNCTDHRCPKGWVCDAGNSCQMIAPTDACLKKTYDVPPTAESVVCNGQDEDHNCAIDDYIFKPVGPGKIIDGPRAKGGESCGRCGTDTTDYRCAANWVDGRPVVLYLSDKNTGERTTNPNKMTSCLYFKTPCSNFLASKVDLKWRGVETSRPCADKLPCGTSCGTTTAWVFGRKPGTTGWRSFGYRKSYVEIDRTATYSIPYDWNGVRWVRFGPVSEVLVCRGNWSTLAMDVAVDGVSMQGCCK